MFTDIEGSTPLLERAGARYPVLLNEHRRIIRDAVGKADGVEHGTEGDSFFVTFDSPTAALAAAVEAQLELERHPWPDGLRVRVRMGLHVGEVLHHDGDLVGMAIHHAARIGAAAHGGQIMLSDAVRAMARSLPESVDLRSLGRHRLRDVGDVELFQVDHPGLGREFPPPRGVQQQRTNLPRLSTVFVGGEPLLASIEEQSAAAALVTLTGTGGVGKTRAAIEYASRHMDRFPHGVYFVDLAPITETDAVVGAITSVLPVIGAGESAPIENLIEWIADRTMLLVVDNCEHLVADVHDVLETLLGSCSNLRVIATSREALGVRGERVVRVPSLDAHTDAVELFHQRALAADSSFTIGGHRTTIVQICTRLDGIPLAIELAASRVRSLSPAELLTRLEDRFRLLRGSGRGTLDRHQTLRATVTWSYQLLSEHEQILLDRLSVFAGGWTIASAEAVCGDDPIDELDIVDLLSSLVDKSMVVADRGPVDTRYRLLETIRQFAEEHLETSDNQTHLRNRHAAHIGELVTELDAMFNSRLEFEGARRFEQEWDNLRAAHQWAIAQRNLQLAEQLTRASYEYADDRVLREHHTFTERTVAVGDDLGIPSPVMLAYLAGWQRDLGDQRGAVDVARRGIDAAPWPTHPDTAQCWYELACSPLLSSDSDQVQRAFKSMQAAVDGTPESECSWTILVNLLDAAMAIAPSEVPSLRNRVEALAAAVQLPRLTAFLRLAAALDQVQLYRAGGPDFAGSAAVFQEVLDLATGAGNLRYVGFALRGLALTATAVSSPTALRRCADALETLHDLRFWQKTWQVLDSATLALADAGRHDAATRLLGYLDEHVAAYGMEHQLGFRDRVRGALAGHDDPDGAAAAARMTADEIVLAAIEWCSE
jgi:predicted ATPase/class 3 adenylate cyclase